MVLRQNIHIVYNPSGAFCLSTFIIYSLKKSIMTLQTNDHEFMSNIVITLKTSCDHFNLNTVPNIGPLSVTKRLFLLQFVLTPCTLHGKQGIGK